MNTAAALPNSSSLWHIADEMLRLMITALGGPGSLAAHERISRKTRRSVLDWLEPLETLVRKLLLVEAAKLPRPAERRDTKRTLTLALIKSWQRRKKPRRAIVEPNRPSTWRVTFRLAIPRDPALRKRHEPEISARVRAVGRPMLVRDIHRDQAAAARKTMLTARKIKRASNALLRLAQRFEAVRRVIADPAPHAERLARALFRKRKSAAPAAQRLALIPAPRRDRGFADVALKAATLQAIAATPAFKDSS
jgi:hypothetical protein